MINLYLKINELRKISFYLFFVSSIAIILSLLLHNLLVSYKFSEDKIPYEIKYPFKIKCNLENNFCHLWFQLHQYLTIYYFHLCKFHDKPCLE